MDSSHTREGVSVLHSELLEEAGQGIETVGDIFTVSISAYNKFILVNIRVSYEN